MELRHELLGLQQIPAKKWADFKRRVKRSKGKILLLVHPFYAEVPTGSASTYNKMIINLLSQERLPIIVLEQHKDWENNNDLYPPHALVLPTHRNSPTPILKVSPESNHKTNGDDHHALLAQLLSKAGVTRIRIAGMQTKISRDSQLLRETREIIEGHEKSLGKKAKPPFINWGCVGVAYANLIKLNQFKRVELIPQAVNPLHPGYYHTTKPFPELE